MDSPLRGGEMGAGIRGRKISPVIDKKTCLCFRPHCFVLCTNCGWDTWGRVSHSCPVHPMTMYLNDVEMCPQCRAYKPFLVEYPECKPKKRRM